MFNCKMHKIDDQFKTPNELLGYLEFLVTKTCLSYRDLPYTRATNTRYVEGQPWMETFQLFKKTNTNRFGVGKG